MKTVLIKLGGSALDKSLNQFCDLIFDYQQKGFAIIAVHGGGPAINKELTNKGITWNFINGQRKTTPEMMTVINDVLSNQVNKKVVDFLNKNHIKAKGLSGAKNSILFCSPANVELGLVGKIEEINSHAIKEVLAENIVAVISPIGRGINANDYFNINADWAATKLATDLAVDELVFLTDQNGILDEQGEVIKKTSPDKIYKLIEAKVIYGGMQTKVLSMIDALKNGVNKIRVLNALEASSCLRYENIGTILNES